MPHSISIKATTWAANKAELMNIRTQVFMLEQLVSAEDEWDLHDESATHFLVYNENNQPIGCARLLREDYNQQNCFHIGRVAILKPYRTLGIGHQLMLRILDYCRHEEASSSIYLHAQTIRQSFYEHLGFCKKDNEFMDAGIPHITMWYKKLIE